MAENESRSWRWADADGVQSTVDEWELLSSLSTGTLPPYTLVWRKGWDDWYPACQIAELASVLAKDQLETTVAPKLDPKMSLPPPPPIDKYTTYQTRAAAAKLLGRLGRPSRPAPAPPPGAKVIVPPPQPTPQIRSRTKTKAQTSTPAPPAAKKAGTSAGVPPPAPPPRPAQPTLVENMSAPVTATLRPPGAVPPPPRGVPAPHDVAPTELTPEPSAPVVAITVPHAPAVATPLPTIVVLDSSPISSEQPTSPQASKEPLKPPRHMLRSEPLPSWSDDLDAEYRLLGRPAAAANEPNDPTVKIAAQPSYRARLPSVTLSQGLAKGFRERAPIVIVGAVALGGVMVVAIIGIVVVAIKATSSPTPTSSASAVASAKPKKPPGLVKPCRVTKDATKIAPKIYPLVTPVTAPAPSGSRIAVGFAESERSAIGMTIDPSTLESTQSFSQEAETAITGVVPLVERGNLEFAVDRDGGTLRAARTLDGAPPAQLGWTDAGFTKLVKGQEVVTLWPGTLADKATETRIARVPGAGHAVTFRRGGQNGEVFVGLLDAKGNRQTDLASMKSQSEVGTPAVAANEYGTLVAFAARPSADSYWGIQLAYAAAGEVPKSASAFRLPPGGPGAEAIAPSPEGLSNGGFLLQWSEGAAGKRQVRVQTLGADLVPVGDPTTLSPDEANAGQGVVMVRGGKALSLFLVKKGKTHELWGASLTCP